MLDIMIVAGVGIVQIILTWYAVHISVRNHRKRNAAVFILVGAVGLVLTLWATVRNNKAQESVRLEQQKAQRKLDQAQHSLQVSEDQTRDCNARIEAVDQRLLAMSKNSPPKIRKEVGSIHRHFERNLTENLSTQDTIHNEQRIGLETIIPPK